MPMSCALALYSTGRANISPPSQTVGALRRQVALYGLLRSRRQKPRAGQRSCHRNGDRGIIIAVSRRCGGDLSAGRRDRNRGRPLRRGEGVVAARIWRSRPGIGETRRGLAGRDRTWPGAAVLAKGARVR